MPDKKQCCHRGCHNTRVTFEDAVVAQIQWKGVIVPEFWFGFYCQSCKDEDAMVYQRFVEDKVKNHLSGPIIDRDFMKKLEIEEDQFPSHAQERLALMRLTPETFYHPEVGYRGRQVLMVYCKPPIILENVNGTNR